MAVIRGKLESKREVLPKRTVFGKSPFIRIKEGLQEAWTNTENPEAKPKELSLKDYLRTFNKKALG